MPDKSLQINVDSVADAKSVIANLGDIKAAYEAHGCTSIELCIFEEVVTPTMRILVGAFPWCVEYRKTLKPFEGNVLFQLPHYCEPQTNGQPTPAPTRPAYYRADPAPVTEPAEPEIVDAVVTPPNPVDVTQPAPKVNRYLRNAIPGKTALPVQAPPSEGP